MVTIVYVEPSGTEKSVDVPVGRSVMEGAVMHGIDGIVAECGGACSCATCHAHIDADWMETVGPAGEDERDMLELASDVGPDSRLTCQITVSQELDGLRVRVAEGQG